MEPNNVCPNCSRFIGDYNGIAVGNDGSIHAVWIDMRRLVPFGARFLFTEDAFYARRPAHPFAPPATNPFPGSGQTFPAGPSLPTGP